MTADSRTVEIAGLSFEASGSGEVLRGVAGPQPSKDCPSPRLPLEGLTRAGVPLHRWSDHPDGAEAPIFVFDEPIIYVGTTRFGLHSVLLGVKTTEGARRRSVCCGGRTTATERQSPTTGRHWANGHISAGRSRRATPPSVC